MESLHGQRRLHSPAIVHPRFIGQAPLQEVREGRATQAVDHPALLPRGARAEHEDGSLRLDLGEPFFQPGIRGIAEDAQVAVAVDLGQVQHDQHVVFRLPGHPPDQLRHVLVATGQHRRRDRDDQWGDLAPHRVDDIRRDPR